MRQAEQKNIIAIIALCLGISGCASFNTSTDKMKSAEDCIEMAKKMALSGDITYLLENADTTNVSDEWLNGVSRSPFKPLSGIKSIQIYSFEEHQMLKSTHSNWNVRPDKVIVIEEMDADPNSYFKMTYGIIQANGCWKFAILGAPNNN